MAEVNGIKWHVISQRQTTQLSSVGTGFTDVWEVGYMIDSGDAAGSQGMVRIPASQYTPEVVEATISRVVGTQHSIAGL